PDGRGGRRGAGRVRRRRRGAGGVSGLGRRSPPREPADAASSLAHGTAASSTGSAPAGPPRRTSGSRSLLSSSCPLTGGRGELGSLLSPRGRIGARGASACYFCRF